MNPEMRKALEAALAKGRPSPEELRQLRALISEELGETAKQAFCGYASAWPPPSHGPIVCEIHAFNGYAWEPIEWSVVLDRWEWREDDRHEDDDIPEGAEWFMTPPYPKSSNLWKHVDDETAFEKMMASRGFHCGRPIRPEMDRQEWLKLLDAADAADEGE